MLKTKRGGEYWLVTQPDHAALSGELASHWGNAAFHRPGAFAAFTVPDLLRAETILAIAEHDNGWWEWETDPPVSTDGLPLGLGEVLRDREMAMDRWRRGIPRMAETHPYASLLIGHHAYWLYAGQIEGDLPEGFTHSLFRRRPALDPEIRLLVESFADEIRAMRANLEARMSGDQQWAPALDPPHLYPHARLLQVLDAWSLAFTSTVIPTSAGEAGKGFGEDEVILHDVPRSSWEDRVSIHLRPAGNGVVICDPYPFGTDPIEVTALVRTLPENAIPKQELHSWWYRITKKPVRYRIQSASRQ